MIIVDNLTDLRHKLEDLRPAKGGLGFVPTMGALHNGHLSLIKASNRDNAKTVVSIFINPTQFNDEQDFTNYPRHHADDLKMLEEHGGVDMVFLPTAEQMYPPGFLVSVEPGPMANHLCGMTRIGHFKGVLTVVLKLFNLVQPTRAYFGAKDMQQFLLISKMVEDFNLPVDLVMCPTLRDEDGLAMSSRNALLSATLREEAPTLYQALEMGYRKIKNGETTSLQVIAEMMTHIIENSSFEIDYLSIVSPFTLEDIDEIDLKKPFLMATAAYLGEVRLIDNILHRPN